MPKVSFVVPVYNKQAYIVECLDSLQKQTMKDIEVIIVDDGSTDASVDLVKIFTEKDKRFKLFKLKKNMGRSYARNYGNKKAKSKIICVQDADDISALERAESIYNCFKYNKKADVFYSGFFVVDSIARVHKKIRPIAFDIEKVMLHKVTYICHSTMAYKKDKIIPYSSGDWCKYGLDDWKLQLDCYKKKLQFVYLDNPLVMYRNVPNSTVEVRNKMDVINLKMEYLRNLKI